ncbi:hypothetical protein BT63DRAFT_461649 [Microthyrium microscopicum]|uniref:Uncharacterized protein n=1 Tax=Microthyrium microscopicum TaxID=703497 RepID=A0A6A6TUG5_9PEZI|nr:hypothetical protein BT63DRAFT_461649 [Microthyrium microscopicum]
MAMDPRKFSGALSISSSTQAGGTSSMSGSTDSTTPMAMDPRTFSGTRSQNVLVSDSFTDSLACDVPKWHTLVVLIHYADGYHPRKFSQSYQSVLRVKLDQLRHQPHIPPGAQISPSQTPSQTAQPAMFQNGTPSLFSSITPMAT